MTNEKAYRMLLYKLGGLIFFNVIAFLFLPYLLPYICMVIGYFPNKRTDIDYLIYWIINDILVYASPIIFFGLLFKNKNIPLNIKSNNPCVYFTYRHLLLIPAFLVMKFIVFGGGAITEIISNIIYSIFGVGQTEDIFAALWPENTFRFCVFIIMTVVIAPLIEEFIFRKSILGQLKVFGYYPAIFVSALLFGLFHGNHTQFLYAFLSGILLGFVAVWSGSVWPSVILHAVNNAFEVFITEMFTLTDSVMVIISFYILIAAGFVSFIIMIVKGMFVLKNPCPDIPGKRNVRLMISNPLLVLGIVIMIMNMFL